LFREDDILYDNPELAKKEEEEQEARDAIFLSKYVPKRGPKPTSKSPANIRRRALTEEKKLFNDWKAMSPDTVGWREKFDEIEGTQYGAMKIKYKEKPNTPKVNLVNEKLVDGLRRLIPAVGKLQNTYVTSKICVDEKKVRVQGRKPNIDGHMATALGVNAQTIRQSIRRRVKETAPGSESEDEPKKQSIRRRVKETGPGSESEDEPKKQSQAEISLGRQYPPNVQKKKWNDHEQRGHQAFFERIAHILSGTGVDSNRRHIAMAQHEVKIELYAETPQILCQIFDDVPLITERSAKKDHFTRFQASMLAAVHQRNQPGFDAGENYLSRKKDAQEAYTAVLENLQRYRSSKSDKVRARVLSSIDAITTQDPKTLMAQLSISHHDEHIANDDFDNNDLKTRENIAKVEAILRTDNYTFKADRKAFTAAEKLGKQSEDKKPDKRERMYNNFDASTYNIRVRTMDSFFGMLKAKGIKYTYNVHRHPCPVHEEGPIWERKLKQIEDELSKLTTDMDSYAQTKAACRHATWKVLFYHVHKKQYEYCRPYTDAILETMRPGKCMIYRDFVNQHNEQNGKVANLVLVVLWREVEKGPLNMIKISNICTDADSQSTDAAFVADVMNNHFAKGRNSFFDRFTHVYLVGDHGSHFSCKQTFWEESQFFSKYRKVLTCLFLCSYHCYNRCDGAGLEVKLVANVAVKNHKAPITAEHYAALVNNGPYVGSHAIAFPRINRSEPPVKLKKIGDDLHRKFCHLQFWYKDENNICKSEPGIVLAKVLSGPPSVSGKFHVLDLLDRELCQYCSNLKQRPMRHVIQQCPFAEKDPLDRNLLKTPDPLRIVGTQFCRKFIEASRKKKKES
jgi:hypothetical protein